MVEKKDLQDSSAIHPKRTLAFVNHFVIKNVQFMNNFASKCDTNLMEFEYKIQKLEASLAILEAKLASIPGFSETSVTITNETEPEPTKNEQPNETEIVETTSSHEDIKEVEPEIKENNPKDDSRYSKYFKMIQFGVPLQAVKLKVAQEGLDPNVLG